MAVDEELSVSWSVEMEVNLFHAMRGHKPVGVNKNFQMMCIHDKLQQSMGRKVTSQQIWQHLSTMYDMQALHESEILPFPNNQSEFTLPTEEYGELMSGKRKAAPSNVEEKKDNSPKRKRTRQGTSAPNPDILASKRRR
ncbi:MRG/MORF4L-binding protein-like isoform X2 [Acanthaster planci]|uniref:MRG/MORF4L-binding protein-like isoform X2 n=1 Tax=Acanthaster planci TaxID=133434 RepID=A0A8B7YWK6_ACAPL|nr:MRG/MORF4L-binding protein-like isoform X2 [Acanthaster planci]